MSSSPHLENIMLAGATGSIGSTILTALLNEPSFKVTILSRTSSTATFPLHLPVKRVSDSFTHEELTSAFRGQDAVINALSTGVTIQTDLPFRLIDAAAAAGVKRFIPSEYGTNNLDPRARELVPVYDAKGKVLEYLMKKAAESAGRFTWTSVACGWWVDWYRWAPGPTSPGNFLSVDVTNHEVTIWDSGTSKFAATTISNAGLAVARSLVYPEETRNKQIFVADFITSAREFVASLESVTGQKFTVQDKKSGPAIEEAQQKFKEGDYSTVASLVALSVVADVEVGFDFEKEGHELWNEKLGLPTVTLDDVVREAAEFAAE